MSKVKSKSPEVSGIKINVAAVSNGSIDTALTPIGHVDSVGSVIDKSRNVQKYTPMNDLDYEEIVAMGSLTQAAFSMTILYDPESVEGINKIEKAIDDNEEIGLILEFNNKKSPAGAGTTIKQVCKVATFKVDGETNGKYKATFSAERIGSADVIPAS